MALPGGRQEPADQDLLETAIRETREELGLRLQRDQLAGTLADVVPRNPALPPIAVRPFVFLIPGRPQLSPNHEVASAHWVPLDNLQEPATYQPVSLEVRGSTREVPAFRLADAVVWGMTERILTELLPYLYD